MGVNNNLQAAVFLERLDQVICFLRGQQRSHVLDAEGLAAHALEFLGLLDVLLEGVNRALGVAHNALCFRAGLEALVDSDFDVAQIVQRVEDTDDVDAVFNRLADKAADCLVGVMTIAQNVLAAQQHLQLGVRHVLADRAQSLPRIFVQVTKAGIERRTAPALDRVVAGLIHGLENVNKILDRNTGRAQRLVCVTQDGLCNVNFLWHSVSAPLFDSMCANRTGVL